MKTQLYWRSRRYPRPNKTAFARLAARASELAGLPGGDWELAVNFVGDRAMAQANAEFVGHEGTTDVITFSYFDDPENLFPGETAIELLISLDVAHKEGAVRPETGGYAGELALYLVHGLLHSAGEDDLSPEPRARMRLREQEVLNGLKADFDFAEIFPEPMKNEE